jgi:hypothetical protein
LPPPTDGLRPPADVQLLEEAGGVGLHRVLGHEQPLADLPVAEPFGDQAEDLVLSRRDGAVKKDPFQGRVGGAGFSLAVKTAACCGFFHAV